MTLGKRLLGHSRFKFVLVSHKSSPGKQTESFQGRLLALLVDTLTRSTAEEMRFLFGNFFYPILARNIISLIKETK